MSCILHSELATTTDEFGTSIEVQRIIIHQMARFDSQAPIDETCNTDNMRVANAQVEPSELLAAMDSEASRRTIELRRLCVTIAFQTTMGASREQ